MHSEDVSFASGGIMIAGTFTGVSDPTGEPRSA
jgi:hypothetical protein